MPNFYILIFFATGGSLQSCFKPLVLCFSPSSPLSAESFSQHHLHKMRMTAYLLNLSFSYTRKSPPHPYMQMHECTPHSFTYIHKLHAHTVRPMRGTAAHPFHFMVNSAGCEGCVCVCACKYFVCNVVFFFCPCCRFERMCACWVYLLTSHSLSAHMYTQLLL